MQSEQLGGHRPEIIKGQKEAILQRLLQRRGPWVYRPAAVALQYAARLKELRDSGYVIENRTKHSGRQIHGELRLVVCPRESTRTEQRETAEVANG